MLLKKADIHLQVGLQLNDELESIQMEQQFIDCQLEQM
jgi:hypothetical protein